MYRIPFCCMELTVNKIIWLSLSSLLNIGDSKQCRWNGFLEKFLLDGWFIIPCFDNNFLTNWLVGTNLTANLLQNNLWPSIVSRPIEGDEKWAWTLWRLWVSVMSLLPRKESLSKQRKTMKMVNFGTLQLRVHPYYFLRVSIYEDLSDASWYRRKSPDIDIKPFHDSRADFAGEL